MSTGQKITFYGKEAIVLIVDTLNNEVLLFIENNYTKWVDIGLLSLAS